MCGYFIYNRQLVSDKFIKLFDCFKEESKRLNIDLAFVYVVYIMSVGFQDIPSLKSGTKIVQAKYNGKLMYVPKAKIKLILRSTNSYFA